MITLDKTHFFVLLNDPNEWIYWMISVEFSVSLAKCQLFFLNLNSKMVFDQTTGKMVVISFLWNHGFCLAFKMDSRLFHFFQCHLNNWTKVRTHIKTKEWKFVQLVKRHNQSRVHCVKNKNQKPVCNPFNGALHSNYTQTEWKRG